MAMYQQRTNAWQDGKSGAGRPRTAGESRPSALLLPEDRRLGRTFDRPIASRIGQPADTLAALACMPCLQGRRLPNRCQTLFLTRFYGVPKVGRRTEDCVQQAFDLRYSGLPLGGRDSFSTGPRILVLVGCEHGCGE